LVVVFKITTIISVVLQDKYRYIGGASLKILLAFTFFFLSTSVPRRNALNASKFFFHTELRIFMIGIMKAPGLIYKKILILFLNFSKTKLHITLQFCNQSP
jgi:hypothetical protein